MRKCDRNRIKKRRIEQKFQRCWNRVYNAYAKTAGSKPESQLYNNPEVMPEVVSRLSTRDLRMICERPNYFVFIGHEILIRLAQEAIVERALKLERV